MAERRGNACLHGPNASRRIVAILGAEYPHHPSRTPDHSGRSAVAGRAFAGWEGRLLGIVLIAAAVAGNLCVVGSPAEAADPAGAESRLATFETAQGDNYFALAVRPADGDSLRQQLSAGPRSVLIVVDTSASQSGPVRSDALSAVDGLLDGLDPSVSAAIAAIDVRATMLSSEFAASGSSDIDQARSKLEQRLPLGNTDLAAALQLAVEQLSARPGQRSVVYVGDGVSLGELRDPEFFAAIIDRLRTDQISVHSLAIGPTTDVSTLATLANQTGGVTLVNGANERVSSQQLGMMLSTAAVISPVWPTEVQMPAGYTVVQEGRLPPVRLDRDSVLLGRIAADAEGLEKTATIALKGLVGETVVDLKWQAKAEPSHPDFTFLPSMVAAAEPNHGLLLPTAGSAALREAARVMVRQAQELVRAGRLALAQGNLKGARALAESALAIDPHNPEAKTLLSMTSEDKTLTVAQDEDPFGAPPAGDNPFADAPDLGAEPVPAPAPPAVPVVPAVPVEPVAPVVPVVPAAPVVPPSPMDDAGFDDAGFDGAGLGDLDLGAADFGAAPGGLLDRVEAERAQLVGRMRAEVRARLQEASRRLATDPVNVTGELKVLLGVVESEPNLPPQVRGELVREIQSAIRQASRREAAYYEDQATLQQQLAGAAATERLLELASRDEARLAAAVQQFNALLTIGEYDQAVVEVVPAIEAIDGYRTVGEQVDTYGAFGLAVTRANRYRTLRHRAFVDSLALNEKALIPFVDEPPIVYPDAEVWQRLSERRLERYGSIELTGDNESERAIYRALEGEFSQNFNQIPLEDAVRIIATESEIPIIINTRALEDLGLTRDLPVTIDLQNVTLRSFLRLMLRESDLTYMIKDEVLQITTIEDAEDPSNAITKVYPVGDLVVPVIQLGGMGGMGGGMGGMGGGMGGMGGGMGGMGGGMGGMGGGMGGMGGGMGMGGMMAVPDDASLEAKAPVAKAPAAKAPVAGHVSADDFSAGSEVPLRVTPAEGQTIDAAWAAHFASLELPTAEAQALHDARVRTTVRQLNVKAAQAIEKKDDATARRYYDEVRAVIAAALRSGAVQPWMHQGYAIALTAIDADPEEIERALLSAADVAETPDELLLVASHLERLGRYEAGLKLCRDVSRLEPYRSEPYLIGLRLAREIDDVEGLAWACKGVLSQAWPKGQEALEAEVRLLARATYQQLAEEGKPGQAEAFAKAVNQSAARDCIIEVVWTGDADIDLAVEEPAGTICSIQNPRSTGGGVLLGDGYSSGSGASDGQIRETYICPQGFSGRYRLLVRRVWGNVSTGQVTVNILTDAGRPSEKLISKQIPLTEKDALITFEVKEGRREEEMVAAQLEQLRDVQEKLNGAVLAQIGAPAPVANAKPNGPFSDPSYADLMRDFYRSGQLAQFARNGGFGRGAVGYQPVIQTIPEGTMMMAIAVISGDRRYVRITPAPTFSAIGDVSTFNFVSGEEGAGTGGVGGAGGGLGGGGVGGGFQ